MVLTTIEFILLGEKLEKARVNTFWSESNTLEMSENQS